MNNRAELLAGHTPQRTQVNALLPDLLRERFDGLEVLIVEDVQLRSMRPEVALIDTGLVAALR